MPSASTCPTWRPDRNSSDAAGAAGIPRRRAAGLFWRTIEATLSVAIAPQCASCAQPLHQVRGGPVCGACWLAIHPFTPPICDACGDPLATAQAGSDGGLSRCRLCRQRPGAVAHARAIGHYDGTLRNIIHAFKYDTRRSIGIRLGALMAAHGRDVLDGADIAVPVPLHWWRRHRRGFNQAAVLAHQLDLPVCDLLTRTRHTPAQVRLPASDRRRNVHAAFALALRYRWRWLGWLRRDRTRTLSGLTVVLVDDVSTTGATLDACAVVLMAAGVREVRAITAARVASRRR